MLFFSFFAAELLEGALEIAGQSSIPYEREDLSTFDAGDDGRCLLTEIDAEVGPKGGSQTPCSLCCTLASNSFNSNTYGYHAPSPSSSSSLSTSTSARNYRSNGINKLVQVVLWHERWTQQLLQAGWSLWMEQGEA